MTQPGRVILPHVHVMRETRSRDGSFESLVVTGILLPNLLENLVYAGALEVIVTDEWRYKNEFANAVSELPDNVLKYVKFKNLSARVSPVLDGIFNPIFDEFGITYDGVYRSDKADPSDEWLSTKHSIIQAHARLPRFLEALFSRSQFHFDIGVLVQHLENIRNKSRSPENRINIAGLTSLLSVYESVELEGPVAVVSSISDKSDRLMELFLSHEYQALSDSHSMLGSFGKIPNILSQIRLRAKQLMDLKPTRGILNYSAKAAQVATSAPSPSTEIVDNLVGDTFLPPIIDLSHVIRNAKRDLIENGIQDDIENYFGL